MRLSCLLLLLSGCWHNSFGEAAADPPDMAPPDPRVPNPDLNCSKGVGKKGELGQLSLTLGFLSQDPATGAFATGSHDQLSTSAIDHDRRIAAVTSTHPEVLVAQLAVKAFLACGNEIIAVSAISQGTTELVFADAEGAVIDRFQLEVADTGKLETDPVLGDVPTLIGWLHSPLELHVITETADGGVLHGFGAPAYTTTGAAVHAVALDSLAPDNPFAGHDDGVRFELTAGAGALTMSAPGTMRTLSFRGVEPSEIDALTVTVGAVQPAAFSEWSVAVTPRPRVGGTLVSAMPCDTIDLDTHGYQPGPQSPVIGLPFAYDLRAQASPGDYTLRCTIGSQTATAKVRIP